jgi:hypothetical protein
MEYKILGITVIVLAAIYVAIRLAGQWAFSKLIKTEFEHVLNHEEHKVKGRYD